MSEESECACSVARILKLQPEEAEAGEQSCVAVDETLNRVTVRSENGTETRVTVDHAFLDSIPVEDVYQDAIYPFAEALFTGVSTVVFNFGTDADRARFLYDRETDDQGLLNLAVEQVFTNVKASSGSGMQFLVHASMFGVRKDKVTDALGDGSKSFSVKDVDPKKGGRPEVRGLKQEVVESEDAFDALYERAVAGLPADCIRVVALTVEMNEPDPRGNDRFRQGSLIVVDVCEGKSLPDKTKLVGLLAGLAEGMKASALPFSAFKLGKYLRWPLGGAAKLLFVGNLRESDGNFPVSLEGVKLLQLCSNIRTCPQVETSAAMLENTKKEIEKLKASIHKNFKKNADKREEAVKQEQNARQSALQQRLARRAKEGKPVANMTEEEKLYRPTVIVEEKVVEVEKVVEKVREVTKVVEVVDKKQVGIQNGLNELNDTVRAHQAKLESDLKAKQQSLEEGEQQRLEAEQKLKELQQRVLGLGGGGGGGGGGSGDAPDVILAKQQASYRKAQYKLQQQQKKEEKLQAMRKEIEGEQAAARKELAAAQANVAKQKAELAKIRSEYDKKVKDAKQELDRQRRAHAEQVNTVREQIAQQESNIKLLTQIAEYFLTPTELSKVWEKSKFDEGARRWTLPAFRARGEWDGVRLQDNADAPASQAIEVDGHLLGSNPETGAMGPRYKSPAPSLPANWKDGANVLTADGGGGGGSSGGGSKMERAKNKAKDKLKKVKKASAEMCDGVYDMKGLLQQSVDKITGKHGEQDISAAMTMLRQCVALCDRNKELAAEFDSSSGGSGGGSSSSSKSSKSKK